VFEAETLEAHRRLDDHAGIKAGDIKTFAALAHDSVETVDGRRLGREMLAVLKADVDRLGLIFAEGLGDEWSLARMAALSRMIDGWFTLRLPVLLEREFPDAYTVYAGGDDLLLVAPWRDAFALARRIHEDFSSFSLANPDVALSVGLALFSARTPISIPAREAEARLEAAKAAGRNRVCAIEAAPMTWAAFSDALAAAEALNDHLRAGEASTAGLYRLLALDDARQRVARGEASPGDYAWKARLGYQLARMPGDAEARRRAGETIRGLFGLDERFSDAAPRPGVRLAISHALYRNR
jgi:CRISPR-associated protein Csm1